MRPECSAVGALHQGWSPGREPRPEHRPEPRTEPRMEPGTEPQAAMDPLPGPSGAARGHAACWHAAELLHSGRGSKGQRPGPGGREPGASRWSPASGSPGCGTFPLSVDERQPTCHRGTSPTCWGNAPDEGSCGCRRMSNQRTDSSHRELGAGLAQSGESSGGPAAPLPALQTQLWT